MTIEMYKLVTPVTARCVALAVTLDGREIARKVYEGEDDPWLERETYGDPSRWPVGSYEEYPIRLPFNYVHLWTHTSSV